MISKEIFEDIIGLKVNTFDIDYKEECIVYDFIFDDNFISADVTLNLYKFINICKNYTVENYNIVLSSKKENSWVAEGSHLFFENRKYKSSSPTEYESVFNILTWMYENKKYW